MANKKTRLEMIVSNKLLQGDVQDCFTNWKKALAAYQAATKRGAKTEPEELVRLRNKFEKLSWDFVLLTGHKKSVRDAMIWELGRKDNPVSTSKPIQLKMGLNNEVVSVAEYDSTPKMQALHLPLHIIVEPNTTVEEIKQFLAANKQQINQLLATQKVGTLEPLRVERDKAIRGYAAQGMRADEIAVEIELEQRFEPLYGKEGISVATVEKVIQRNTKNK